MNKLKLAIIGAGHLGRIHARIASGQEAVDQLVIADPSESARRAVTQLTGAVAVDDYRILLNHPHFSKRPTGPIPRQPQLSHPDQADCGRHRCLERAGIQPIDAAIVATPTTAHHAVVRDLIDAHIPVLVEKPVARTIEEANDLVRRSEEARVVLQVGHVERYNPALVAVLPHLANPKYIVAERCSGYPGRSLDVGVVLDLMIHDLDIVLALAQSPVRDIDALGISVLGGYEDLATARLVFENGCVAQLTASRVSYTTRRAMQVYTPDVFASVDYATGEATLVRPNTAVLKRQFYAPGLSVPQLQQLQKDLFDRILVRKTLVPPAVNAIEQEQRDFFDAVRFGQVPRVDGRAGRDALAVAERILAAVARHAWDGDSASHVGPFAVPDTPTLRPAA